MHGQDGNGSYGFCMVDPGILGSGLPTLKKKVIVGIWTDKFFLGNLGISPVLANFNLSERLAISLLGSLRNQPLIPSASWAYTGGAHYKNPPLFGSLTLGGFDITRYIPNDLDFSFGTYFSRDSLLGLQSINYDTFASSPFKHHRHVY